MNAQPAGLTVDQLITDLGRTANLILSASLAAKAQNENAVAAKEQILLAVNQAFFSALQAQAVLTVAQRTIKDARQYRRRVGTLSKNKLKSGTRLLPLCEREPGAGTASAPGWPK